MPSQHPNSSSIWGNGRGSSGVSLAADATRCERVSAAISRLTGKVQGKHGSSPRSALNEAQPDFFVLPSNCPWSPYKVDGIRKPSPVIGREQAQKVRTRNPEASKPTTKLLVNWHIKAIAHQLEQIRLGQQKRLIVSAATNISNQLSRRWHIRHSYWDKNPLLWEFSGVVLVASPNGAMTEREKREEYL